MAARANYVHEIATVLAEKLPEELGKRYHWVVKVCPTGYNGYICVDVISDYFKKIDDYIERNLIIADILRKYLPKPEKKVTMMAAFTPAEYRRYRDEEVENERFKDGVIRAGGAHPKKR